MKKIIFAVLVLTGSSALAEKYDMNCASTGQNPFTLKAVYVTDIKTLFYAENDNLKVKNDFGTVLDDRCGSLTPLADEQITFEVTGEHSWAQDILQLPVQAFQPGVKTISGRIHWCWFDGNQSANNDEDVTCEISKQ